MHHRRAAGIASALLVLAPLSLAACGTDAGGAQNCRTASGGTLTLVASDVAWNASCINARPGTLRFTVDSKDDVQHNLRVTGNGTNEHTELQSGPIVQHLSVTLKEGTYTYVCDIHANMEGKLYVK